jgi:multiple sugar transport system substrate-binding protein
VGIERKERKGQTTRRVFPPPTYALYAFYAVTTIPFLSACGVKQEPNEIVVQRFFGLCQAQYGTNTDVAKAETECGIITSLLNKFRADNPEIRVRVSTVAWPGYNELAAQIVTNDAPDVVTMHESAISDFQSRGLLEPMEAGLRKVGVDPASFTEAGLKGVTKEGTIFGMPFDTWAPLFHINMNYFRQAGLVRDGQPILPSSPDELLVQARQFKRATGKPYFVQALANQKPAYTRNFFTFLMQQNSDFFADPQRIKLQTPEARRVVEMFKIMYDEGLTTKDQDYAAATNGFMNGDGGVYLVGTWVIGDFDAESRKPDRPLSNGYTVYPFPQLFAGRDATYADGHAWVMPKKERTPQQRDAAYRLMRFLADHDFEWSRTGHLPAFRAVIDSERFKSMPHRKNIAKLTTTGTPLAAEVQRQFALIDIIGEELAPAIAGQKSIDAALADAEHRVNELLFHVM